MLPNDAVILNAEFSVKIRLQTFDLESRGEKKATAPSQKRKDSSHIHGTSTKAVCPSVQTFSGSTTKTNWKRPF